MTFLRVVAAMLVAGGTAGWATPPAAGKAPAVHVVHLVGYTYDPGDILATRGDTIRFVQDGAMPHNVEFSATPPTAALGAARIGRYLIKEGDTYDLVIDQRFPAGVYQFACTPHHALGMKGTLTVR